MCVQEEISRVIKNFFELNEKENTIYQELWNAAKTVLGEKFIALNTLYLVSESS